VVNGFDCETLNYNIESLENHAGYKIQKGGNYIALGFLLHTSSD